MIFYLIELEMRACIFFTFFFGKEVFDSFLKFAIHADLDEYVGGEEKKNGGRASKRRTGILLLLMLEEEQEFFFF